MSMETLITNSAAFTRRSSQDSCFHTNMVPPSSRTYFSRSRVLLFDHIKWSISFGDCSPIIGAICKHSVTKKTYLSQFRISATTQAVGDDRKMNLNEYMVTLHKPLGIRFGRTDSGKVYVDALAKQGNGEKTRMIVLGDLLKKVVFPDVAFGVEDFEKTMDAIKNQNGPISLVFERSAFPTNLQSLIMHSRADSSLKFGDVDKNEAVGDVGRVYGHEAEPDNIVSERFSLKAVTFYTDQDTDGKVEWSHGNYSFEEYTSAQARAANDLYYYHQFGMQYTKITEHIYVGSCIQNAEDISTLKDLGLSAVLNLQCRSEQVNWNIDWKSVETAAQKAGLTYVHCPIRDVDMYDLRLRLPFAVGVLYRLLKKGHRVFLTCTTGLERSPACVAAYFHWIQDVALQQALNFVMDSRPCAPDRAAIVWSTWDLIAMAEEGNHTGPPTHVAQFVWNHGCNPGEEVMLVGDFKGGWDEPLKMNHAGGSKYTLDVQLCQGTYQYKFIIGGHWRHSGNLPTEVDRWGNTNNVITVGGKATARFNRSEHSPKKELITTRVIERQLTEDERFTLAYAARRLAFSISPTTLMAK